MQTFKLSLVRWPFLCIVICWAGCSPTAKTPGPGVCPAGYVGVAPGTFTMGSPTSEAGRGEDETQHIVTITRAYCMKATEVTQGEWQAVMGSNPSHFQGCPPEFTNCWEDIPVDGVTWNDAVAYANALSRRERLPECYSGATFTGLGCVGYRLPMEAEWEYAARAGTTGATYGDLDRVAWYHPSWRPSNWPAHVAQPHPVGQKEPNAWGLYDMLGNVWEWTGDDHYPEPGADPLEGTDSARVIRGGSWEHFAPGSRAAARSWVGTLWSSNSCGFRLARTAP